MRLQQLLERLLPVPHSWFGDGKNEPPPIVKTDAVECTSYADLIAAWSNPKAMKWNDTLDVSLSTLLAVVASTKLLEDQIWLRLIGVAGTAKTTLCQAIAKNVEYAFATSVLTGLHSGYKGEGAGEDASLIPKIRNKTFIINEGDMLLKAPNRDQIMSELRDLYSGSPKCDYRNGKSVEYKGLRCTVVIAGTPTLRILNKSALGDRFLDCIVYEKQSEADERKLVRSVVDSSLEACLTEVDNEEGTPEGVEKLLAQQKTAGYIAHLRLNVGKVFASEEFKVALPKTLTGHCEALGLLVAAMRTRSGQGEEEETEKELHIRLSKQFRKLAVCTAYVMQRPVDKEVMKRVAKVARDTCFGVTFNVVRCLEKHGPMDAQGLAARLSIPGDRAQKAITVLASLECVKADFSTAASGARRGRATYRLSVQMSQLLKTMNGLLDPK